MSYADFLASKALSVAPVGFSPTDYTADLFPFQHQPLFGLLSPRVC